MYVRQILIVCGMLLSVQIIICRTESDLHKFVPLFVTTILFTYFREVRVCGNCCFVCALCFTCIYTLLW